MSTSVNNDSWMANCLCFYLSRSEKYTVFGGRCSTSVPSHGVPQRAVYPLFSFLRDLLSSVENTFAKYVDDLAVSIPISTSLHPLEMDESLSRIVVCF